MELDLKRMWLTDTSTIGELFIDGAFECFTLEDRYRPPPAPKVPRATAIPIGRYHVVITMSQRFGVEMPLLLAVPGFQGIRIHPGNTAADTEGCLLVGRQRDVNRVLESRAAYDVLFAKLALARNAGEKTMITVRLDAAPVC
jgi:hypothetical protein